MVDSRWLGIGGVGRATEHIIRSTLPLRHDIVYWGDTWALRALGVPADRIAPSSESPSLCLGQKSLVGLPKARLHVYLHQIRPLAPGRSLTMIHDLIPIRGGQSRLLKLLYLRTVYALSSGIITVSSRSKTEIEARLGTRKPIWTVRYPTDEGRARRVAAARALRPSRGYVLYTGRFARHKNVERLCDAFLQTSFFRRGGRLVLAGATTTEVLRLRAKLDDAGSIEILGRRSELELDDLFAGAAAVAVPSLEEGYGLPAFEAAAAGIPVAVTATGAMDQLPRWIASFMNPWDVASIAAAIDEATSRERTEPIAAEQGNIAEVFSEAIDTVAGECVR